MTPFGRALYRIYLGSGCVSIAEFCQHMGVSNGSVRHWINSEEPAWLRNLRTIKRRTGLTWGEILDGHAETCGECSNAAPGYIDFLCSECGFVSYHNDENDDGDGWRYCPSCGKRVSG